MQNNTTTKKSECRFKSFGVHIKCSKLQKSIDFYRNLGLAPEFAYGSHEFRLQFSKIVTVPEKYNGVRMRLAGSIVELADGHMAVKPEVFKESIDSSKISAMLDVESVAAVQKTCEKHGYKISVPIKEYPWGTREIVVKDPDGFVLVFIETKA